MWLFRQATGLAALAAIALAAIAAAGCGEDEEPVTSAPVATTPEAAPSEPTTTPEEPLSAGDDHPHAPDDAIEDRPGGPEGPGAAGTTEPSPSDARLIEAAVSRYIGALNADDGETLCRLFAPGALRGIDLPQRRGSCPATLRASIGQPPPDRAPRWLGTTFVDADAVVLVRGGDGRLTGTVVHRFAGSREPSIEEDVIYLRELEGRWRLAKPSATFHRAIGVRDVPLTALTPPR